jgi:hypothetical protein
MPTAPDPAISREQLGDLYSRHHRDVQSAVAAHRDRATGAHRGRLPERVADHAAIFAATMHLVRVAARRRDPRGLRPCEDDFLPHLEDFSEGWEPDQRMPATGWSSHKDIAAKALQKLAGPHVPASLTKLEQAIKSAHAAYDKAEIAAREQRRAAFQASCRRRTMASATSSRRTSTRARRPVPPAGGPTRDPMVARPGGRAGGGGSARQRGGLQLEGNPRWPAASR